ncbi:ABC transporter ATP-binding protein [Salinibacterium sp. dk2585]|uniref:ABC transporter ATP-binding protein n=1 Tax=unclassified Salinibacterium TaxID=2632331 RepID=UPI0011C257EB|nr:MULTISPECIES: ABC transporter ATP-binding protein [unclassified Salinibacterium]QEE60917.1 ABC transporter ATP-binding protein [Salinibacterium sp. dk2585]TXK55988.1 ABC transporter ATP-binding protein [Salinibacterium sp. dk5596]
MTAALTLTDVTLTLPAGDETVTALDHVSLEVAKGELLAIVGPSGSGKSSLLAVAGALMPPTSGSVVVGDQELTGASRKRLSRIRRDLIGFVFQSTNLLPSLTARDQLLMVPHMAGGIRAEHRAKADELLASVGMSHRADRRPAQLSGGERQRVGIARALMGDPQVLLVDEPTSALDHARADEVVALLAERAHATGTACVMVTHDLEVLTHTDRVLRMHDGVLGALPAAVLG